MQLLIVLAAALACAVADPQLYTTGYTGVVPYPGYPAGIKPVAYAAPVGYTGLASTSYPVGYNGVATVIHRARRDAVVPLTTTYTHPGFYSGTPYKAYSPIAYSPVAGVPSGYNYGYAYPTFG